MTPALGRSTVASLLLASCLVLSMLWPRPEMIDSAPDLTSLPASFGEWRLDPTMVPLSPSPDVEAQLDQIYDQIVARTYVNRRGERVMLSIAYGGDQRDALQAHLQEVCYRAQGFAVTGLEEVVTPIAGRPVTITRMMASRGLRSEPVSYWLTMGDEVVRHRGDRLLLQIRYGLVHRQIPDGAMVRVSSLGVDATAAYRLHVDFLEALMAALPARSASLLLARAT